MVQTIADRLGTRRILIPVPFGLWRMLALAAEALPKPPVTRNQVELMTIDPIVSPGRSGFAPLRIEPRSIEETLESLIRRGR